MISLPNRSSIASFVLVVLVVTSSGLAPVGTAAAAEQGNCSTLDDFVMFLTLGAVNAEDCSRQAYVEDAINDMEQSDANQTKVDIYSAASGAKAGQEAWAAPYDNYVNDTQSVAWMKAESAVADAYASGMSKAEAKVAARQAVAEYYHTKQKNLVEQWNVSVSQAATLNEQAEMEENVSGYFVKANATGDPDYGSYKEEFLGLGDDKLLTTVDNQTIYAKTAHVRAGGHNGDSNADIGPTDGQHAYEQNTDSSSHMVYLDGIEVQAPNTNYDVMTYMKFAAFQDRWNRIESLNNNLQSEVDVFVDATWSDFDSGQINATDVISSHTAMFEYGVRSGNESEGLWRSTAALAMMGYDVPNLNSSGTMTVEYSGQTYTGLVMAKNAPNGSWQTGATYYTDSLEGPEFLLTTEGEKIDLDGSFTVTGMTAKDGSQLNETQTTKYVYKTSNTSELLEMQQQLIELRQEIEDREPDGAGDGSGSGSGFSNTQIMVGLAALAGAALLAQNNRGGRQ